MPFLDPNFWSGLFRIGYFTTAVLIVLAVWWVARKSKAAWIAVPMTIAAVGWLPVHSAYQHSRAKQAFLEKEAAQIAHFNERCKSAGEKIYEKVSGVEGILIMKRRVVPRDVDYQDQYSLWDPYGTSPSEAEYPAAYLNDLRFEGYRSVGVRLEPIKGFRFVELLANSKADPVSVIYRRYSFVEDQVGERVRDEKGNLVLKDDPVQTPQSRYGITWDDISTPEDRNLWVAGGRLRVVDLGTNKVIAERVGYLREPSLGSLANNRLAWSYGEAYACPPLISGAYKDIFFLSKVLPR